MTNWPTTVVCDAATHFADWIKMGSTADNNGESPRDAGTFPTTRWTQLRGANHASDSAEASAANEEFFEAYWPCLKRYVSAWGFSVEDAEDFTQGFLTEFIEKDRLSSADPAKGKLRTFLLTLLKRYVINRIAESNAAKRGGGKTPHSISADGAAEIGDSKIGISCPEPPPDIAFDRSWALALMERSVSALEADYERRGQSELFQELRAFLGWNEDDTPHAEVAERLGMKTSNFSLLVFRMRQRLRTFVVDEVRNTISEHEDVDDELRYLRSLFGS